MLLLLRTHHQHSIHCLYDTKASALANIPVLLFESLSLSHSFSYTQCMLVCHSPGFETVLAYSFSASKLSTFKCTSIYFCWCVFFFVSRYVCVCRCFCATCLLDGYSYSRTHTRSRARTYACEKQRQNGAWSVLLLHTLSSQRAHRGYYANFHSSYPFASFFTYKKNYAKLISRVYCMTIPTAIPLATLDLRAGNAIQTKENA